MIITENGSGGTVGNLKLTNDYQLGLTTKALFPKYEPGLLEFLSLVGTYQVRINFIWSEEGQDV